MQQCTGATRPALTKPGRSGTARWSGSGERGGKEYARNRRCYVLDFDTGSNLVDTGRVRCVPLCAVAAGTSGRVFNSLSREATVKVCGVAVVIFSSRVRQGRDLRRPVVDSVADGTLAA